MTTSEVFAYFKCIKEINFMIDRKIEERQELFTLATKSTAGASDGMPSGSGTSDKVGNLTVKIVEIEEEINELIDDYTNYRREAAEFIQKIPVNQSEVIYKNMINGRNIGKIAREMNVTTQWAYRLKNKGIESLAVIITESELFDKYKKYFEIV